MLIIQDNLNLCMPDPRFSRALKIGVYLERFGICFAVKLRRISVNPVSILPCYRSKIVLVVPFHVTLRIKLRIMSLITQTSNREIHLLQVYYTSG